MLCGADCAGAGPYYGDAQDFEHVLDLVEAAR